MTDDEWHTAALEAYKRLEIVRRSHDIKKETLEEKHPVLFSVYKRLLEILEPAGKEG